MEWSDRNDGAAESGGEGDGGAYVPAPVPAHERVWRHPSELGQQAWISSEPPIVIGRGLVVATGVIGCTLGVAMLWLMLSDVSNRPSREPIAMRSTNTVVPPLTASFVAGPNVAGPAIARGTPSNTALLRSRIQVPDSTTAKAIAVAVLVNGSPMLITTANAVSGRLGAFDITLDADGAARVVVDTVDRSLAYLRPTGGTEDLSAIERLQATGFKTAAMAAPGDTLFVLTDKPVAVIFADRLDLSDVLDGAVAEGTPVVDGSGALVALCTIHDGVTQMLSVLPEPTG